MIRLDVMLVNKGIIETRSKAANAIKCGEISVNGKVITKSSNLCSDDDLIEWNNANDSVGRGSVKLQKAIQEFGINVTGKRALDIGASTGGFTQVLLDSGATSVYAVDVGHDQLDMKLRNDQRVSVFEGINARSLDPKIFGGFDIVTIDVSFISLRLILESAYNCLKGNGICIALVKPQFEAGREHLSKHGIVTDIKTHIDTLNDIIKFSHNFSFGVKGAIYSPIKGGKGNIEYFICMEKDSQSISTINIEQIAITAFQELK